MCIRLLKREYDLFSMGLKTCDVDYGTDGAKELEERLFPLWYCENGKANEVQEHQKGV